MTVTTDGYETTQRQVPAVLVSCVPFVCPGLDQDYTKIVLDRNVTASTANCIRTKHVKVVVVGLVQPHTILSLTLTNREGDVLPFE